jgi:hypothetical protein
MRDVARLTEELRECEHREEAIVRRLLQTGMTVTRRPDALPGVVLGVVPSNRSVNASAAG